MATILLIVVALGVSLFSFVRPANVAIEDTAQTERALAQAKEALIAYAAGQLGGSDRPGELPCPDLNNTGQAGASCGTLATQIGRLPTQKLGIPDLRDGTGEKLWYAVSNNFKNNPAVVPLNSHTPGQLTVTGTTPANNVIAIVFAPGATVSGQSRTTANINNVTHYLEGENANGDTNFVVGPASATFNDRLIAITPGMFFPAVEMSVARRFRVLLNSYYAANLHFPPANAYSMSTCVAANQGWVPPSPAACGFSAPSLAPSTSSLLTNLWFNVIFYAVAPACVYPAVNCAGTGGLLTVNGNTNVRALLITPGTAYTGQARPCTSNADCLETPNTTSFPVFTHTPGSATTNDRVVIIAP